MITFPYSVTMVLHSITLVLYSVTLAPYSVSLVLYSVTLVQSDKTCWVLLLKGKQWKL